MKILLTMNLPWLPVLGGANKGNRAVAEALAARGHEVSAVVPALAVPSRVTREEVREELARQGIAVETSDDLDRFTWRGVAVTAVADPSHLRAELKRALTGFRPDAIIVSSEDPSQNLLDAALRADIAPVVYLAHTTSFLPFGPQAFYPSERRTRLLERAAAVVAVSRYVADYIERHSGRPASLLSMPLYGEGPFPDFGAALAEDGEDGEGGAGGEGLVTLINPCAIKGISIFLGLARSLPEVRFGAVPTWGTTAADREALAALANVTLLEPTERIDEIYGRTRVLLLPSLWQEAFGVTAVEAMLRGIPVLASDVGGLPEAKLGTDYLLPVAPIERFTEELDGNELAIPVVPEQDLTPWREALTALLGDPTLYRRQSAAARAAAHRFVAGLGVEPLEEVFSRLGEKPAPATPVRPVSPAAEGAAAEPGMAGLTPEQRALLMLRLRKKAADKGGDDGGPPPIPRAPRDGDLPLSFAQQRLWFLDQLAPGNPAYNIPAAVRFMGDFDVAAFGRAVTGLVRRHEVLRTSFPEVGGEARQVIAPPPETVPLPLIDLSGLVLERAFPESRRLGRDAAFRPFDLGTGPLIRVELMRLNPTFHTVLVNLHHIVADGWSTQIVIGEIAGAYAAFAAGQEPELRPLPIQYADFAVWQRGRLLGDELERQLAFWREKLAGAPPVLELPADRRRPPFQTFRGGKRGVLLTAEEWGEIRAASQRWGVTPFMVALAGYKALLARLTGQEDVLVGSPIAGRNHQEIEGLVGFFVNTLVLRTDLSGGVSFREAVRRVREETLAAYAHQDLPFEEIVKELGGRDLSRNPLFQVMFSLTNVPRDKSEMTGLAMGFEDSHGGTAKFDFDLMTMEKGPELSGSAEFNADLFDAPSVDRILDHWRTLLVAAVRDPERPLAEIPLLTAAGRHQLSVEWNDTGIDFPRESTLWQLFAARAATAPEAFAVLAADLPAVTCGELAARAADLAAVLARLGVVPGDRVGISVLRSPAMVVGLLAISAAGAAYVPLDPSYPPERRNGMLEDARARALIASQSLAETFAAVGSARIWLDPSGGIAGTEPGGATAGEGTPAAAASADHPAYVIYTSGSTGRPKGVMLDHKGRVNNFLDFNRRFEVGPADRLLAVSSLSFDMTAYDVFGILAAGAAIVLPHADKALDPAHWAELIGRHGVTVWHSAPALLDLLAGTLEAAPPAAPLPLRLVLLGGDWIPLALPDRLRALCRGGAARLQVISMGGATEVSMDSTIYEIGEVQDSWSSIPYGRPMANQTAHVVDRTGRATPIGVAGELLLGGVGVGAGYFERPGLTAEKFVPDPFGPPGARLYRTGDLARLRPDGQLELLGRLDFQIKVRGVRIELGEITAALGRHEAVKDAAVTARPDPAGRHHPPLVIAFYVPRRPVEPVELAAALRAELPEAMVPAAWVELPALPLTPNGKIDRKALSEIDPATAVRAKAEHVAPRTSLERVITGVWTDLLRRERVGVHDSFFDLGGHSLLATQVLSRLRSMLPVEVPLRTLLETPTVAGVAAAFSAAAREEGEKTGAVIDLEAAAEMVLLVNELSEEEVQAMLAAQE